MDAEFWRPIKDASESAIIGKSNWALVHPYPGTQVELRKPLQREEKYTALMINTATGKTISLEEYGDLETVAAAVLDKVQDPFAEWYNKKLRLIGVIPKRSFDHMHAVGVHAWKGAWASFNMLIKDVLSDYGIDPIKEKDVSTALAYAVCERLYGKPVIAELPARMKPSEEWTVSEAIELLDGHLVLPEPDAVAVCKVLGAEFNYKLLMMWKDAPEAAEKYGIYGVTFRNGVFALELSYHICEQLGIKAPGRNFTGKGYQGRANQGALREYFAQKSEEK